MRGLFIRLFFVAGIFAFLSYKGLFSWDALWQACTYPWALMASAVIVWLVYLITVLRWWLLLRAQGLELSFWAALRVAWIGQFFNTVLPGAASGDVVKAYYLGKAAKTPLTQAVGSTLLDRVVGLGALVILSAGAMMFHPVSLPSGFAWPVQCCAVAFFGGFLYLYFIPEKWDCVRFVLKWMEGVHPSLGGLTRIYATLLDVRRFPLLVAFMVLLSIFDHILICYGLVLMAHTLQGTLSLWDVLCVAPIGFLVTVVPVAPVGLGTGNLAFLVLFGWLGFQKGAELYGLYAFLQMLLSLFGGVFYVFERRAPKGEAKLQALR
jgi:glycosyltransferase 2 family protein